MNGRTSKLLRRWAFQTKQNYRKLKRHWNTLDHSARGLLRKEIAARLKVNERQPQGDPGS